jgi:diguanylate cyclase (GGDEF)-like protein
MNKTIRDFLKAFLLPLAIVIITILLTESANWQKISAKENELIYALLILLPYFPHFMAAIIILYSWRTNNSGLILNTLLILFAYIFSTIVFLPNLLLFLGLILPSNLFFWSIYSNKNLLNRPGRIYLTLVAFQLVIIFLLAAISHDLPTAFFTDFKTEFPVLYTDIGHLANRLIFLLNRPFENFVLYVVFLGFSLLFLYRYLKTHHQANLFYFGINLLLIPALLVQNDLRSIHLFYSAILILLLLAGLESSIYLAYVDDLTSLPGRRKLNQVLCSLDRKYAIAMIDIDHFKKFNDNFGHETGDQVLKMVASRMDRMENKAKTYRYGGEEFTAIFPGLGATDAKPVLEDYRQTIEKTPFVIRDKNRKQKSESERGKKSDSSHKKIGITVSIGVAQSDKNLNKAEKVLKAADKSLYKAKRLGRNRTEIFEQS